MYMYVCMYMCVYIYIYIRVCVHVYIYIYTHEYMCMYVCMYVLWRSEGSEMSLRAFYRISPSVALARTGRKIDVVLLLPLRCVASV